MDGNLDLKEWQSTLEKMVKFYSAQSRTAGSPLQKLESVGIDSYKASFTSSDLLNMKKEISNLIGDLKSSCSRNQIAEKHLREELGWLNIKASEAIERIDKIDNEFNFSKRGRKPKPLLVAQTFLKGLNWARGDAMKAKSIQKILHPICIEMEKISDLGFTSTVSIPNDPTNNSIEWVRKLRRECSKIEENYLKSYNERKNNNKHYDD